MPKADTMASDSTNAGAKASQKAMAGLAKVKGFDSK
jgi:hypothetical protein